MIRMTRMCLLGKNTSSIPLFAQRAVTLPRQVFVEFGIVADKDVITDLKNILPSQTVTSDELKTRRFVEPYREMKYAFIRDILSGDMRKNQGISNTDTALKEFFNSLPSFRPPEIIKVLKLIAERNTRPLTSLKLLYGLLNSQKDWNYSVKECADVLYCMSKFSLRDDSTIKTFAEKLKQFSEFHSPKAASHILLSLGNLRYKDSELIDKLLNYALQDKSCTKTALTCLKAVCFLNYSSTEVESLIQALGKLYETDFVQSTDYITFIWTTVLLDKVNLISLEHISSVLSEQYITRLLNNGIHPSTKWQLLNINGAAKQMPFYKGPLLYNQSNFKILALSNPNQRSQFFESVLDTLSHILTPAERLIPLLNTGAGFYLDFDFLEPEKENSGSKLGIVLLNFNDICSDGTLSGLATFKVNIIRGMGYKLAPLRHSEYNHSDPLSNKIQLLRKKIQSVTSEPMEKPDKTDK